MAKETLNYLKNLIVDRNVASITPTSSFGVERICRKMDFSKAKVIVEYGPGGGVFTKRLLELMSSDAKLLAIETNTRFIETLAAEIDDKRLILANDSAEYVLDLLKEHGLGKADYMISGIPFSMFSPTLKDRILRNTNEALVDGGMFFVYQFLLSFSASKNDIKRKLDEHMQLLGSEYEFRCVPPLRMYNVEKKV